MALDTNFWDYLSPYQKDLIREGSFLYQEVFDKSEYSFVDYAFLVFPFAKAYEGFLKQFLFDTDLISIKEYNSNHIRLGLLLCPDLPSYDRRSIYLEIVGKCGSDLAGKMWETWKYCRNQVFHYYPHNSKAINLIGAKERIQMILLTINTCYIRLKSLDKSQKIRSDYPRALGN